MKSESVNTHDLPRRFRDTASKPKAESITTTQLLPKAGDQRTPQDRIARIREIQTALKYLPRRIGSVLTPRAFEGQPVWIVGGGPSLASFDFSLLHNSIALGVNTAYTRPECGSMATIDMRFYRWIRDGKRGQEALDQWNGFTGFKFMITSEQYRYDDEDDESMLVGLRSTSANDEPCTLDLFPRCQNSGLMAIWLAYALGCRDIRLLGFDMGATGRQSWWHDPYPVVQGAAVYDGFRPEFNAAALKLSEAGCKVTNYGEDSRLECFPKKSLEAAMVELKDVPPKPTVIGFYTKDTPYRLEANQMIRTARLYGFPALSIERPNLLDWSANTKQKPYVILEALEKENRPILFLDADARIVRYPYAIDAIPDGTDMAFCTFNWADIPGAPMGLVKNKEHEPSSAVMWFAPTAASKRFLKEWIKAIESGLGKTGQKGDQDYLLAVIKTCSKGKDKVKIHALPYDHCQIFDLMASLGDPVIVQQQASRRFKGAVAQRPAKIKEEVLCPQATPNS